MLTVASYHEVGMADKRITVWVQRFKDRPTLMLQRLDPDTGKRKSKSAETADEEKAETARADLEYELNNGLHKQAARISWEKFRELFEAEYLAARRENAQRNYQVMFGRFERLCNPTSLRGIDARTVSRFATAKQQEPGRCKGSESTAASTIQVYLQYLHTALTWAVGQGILVSVPKFPSVKVPKKHPQRVPSESF
jgi:hypothetical protein